MNWVYNSRQEPLRQDIGKMTKRASTGGLETNDDTFIVSSGQKAMWFLYKMKPDSAAYNFKHVARLNGEIDIELLKLALTEVVYHHPILRTTYTDIQGKLMKTVIPIENPNCFYFEVKNLLDYNQEQIDLYLTKTYEQPFNLESGPVMRVHLLKISDKTYVFTIVVHHIATDFTSLELIEQEIGELYIRLKRGDSIQRLEPLDRYTAYAKWENEILSSEVIQESRDYWLKELSGDLPVLNLQTYKSRTKEISQKGQTVAFTVGKELTIKLKNLARKFGTTPYRLLMSAYFILLYRYTGQSDIIIGSPASLRKHSDFQNDVGYFVNMLPFRLAFNNHLGFDILLLHTNHVITEGLKHARYPFSMMVSEVQLNRDLTRTAIFQTSFTMQKSSDASLTGLNKLYLGGIGKNFRFGEFELEPFIFNDCSSQFDLSLFMEEADENFCGWFMYQTDLFQRETIIQMMRHFINILSEAVENPYKSIDEFDVIDIKDKEQVMNVFNDTTIQYEKKYCLHEMIEQRVVENPAAFAVTYEDTSITYAELNQKANQLAHYLIKHGVGPEVMVPICLEPGIPMIISIIGILKSGGAYVPLNPAYPKDRITIILDEIQPNLIISEQSLKDRFSSCTAEILVLDDKINQDVVAEENICNPQNEAIPDNTAYIIYTSGSTGKPKGVMVTHYNVMRLFEATNASYGFGNHDVWTLFHSFAFDFSVWEIFGALLYGGRLVVVPYCISRSPEEFYNLIQQEQVTVLNQTPSAFRQLIKVDERRHQQGKLSLRYIIFGGEALELKTLEPWVERYGDQFPRIINMYGITETTVHVTYRPITIDDIKNGSGSMIGRPISDLQVYLLDKHQHIVPNGCIGEIYVGGAGVAKGYFKRDDLNTARFLPDFINGDQNRLLYRSGDLAKFLPNGDLEYLGRIDHQVKIRGFRIELGDIESKLLEFPGVREVVVLVKENISNDKRLIAYVVMKEGSILNLSTLRLHMKEKLPDYMVPSAFVKMDILPMTPNGKIDKKALPDPKNQMIEELEFVAPRTELQKLIAEIWQTVLYSNRIGIKNNFFDLGGNSMLIVELYSILKEKIDSSLEVVNLFQYPTVELLADFIESKCHKIVDTENEVVQDKAVRRRQAIRNRNACERIS